jgi:hypothetical protein
MSEPCCSLPPLRRPQPGSGRTPARQRNLRPLQGAVCRRAGDADGNFAPTQSGRPAAAGGFLGALVRPVPQHGAGLRRRRRQLEPRIRLGKVNTEEEQALAARFGIRSIPTLVLIHQAGKWPARPAPWAQTTSAAGPSPTWAEARGRPLSCRPAAAPCRSRWR